MTYKTMYGMYEAWEEAAVNFERRAKHPLNYQMESLILGVRRQSAMLLDGAGIVLNMRELPSYPIRENAYRAAFGSGRLSGFWGCVVRPRLFPARHDVLVGAWDAARLQVQAEMLDSVIRQGEQMLDEQPG